MVKNVKSLPGGSTGGDITMVSVGLSPLPCSPWDRIIIQTPTACVTTEETRLFHNFIIIQTPTACFTTEETGLFHNFIIIQTPTTSLYIYWHPPPVLHRKKLGLFHNLIIPTTPTTSLYRHQPLIYNGRNLDFSQLNSPLNSWDFNIILVTYWLK